MLGFEMTSAGRDKSDAADGLQKHDTNWWLHRINLASLISNLEENLIDQTKPCALLRRCGQLKMRVKKANCRSSTPTFILNLRS